MFTDSLFYLGLCYADFVVNNWGKHKKFSVFGVSEANSKCKFLVDQVKFK